MSNIVIAALYKFAKLPDYREMQNGLLDFCVAQGLNGTILLAAEGINGTIAGTRAGVDALMFFLRADARLAGIEHKESYSDEMPFDRMKVAPEKGDRHARRTRRGSERKGRNLRGRGTLECPNFRSRCSAY